MGLLRGRVWGWRGSRRGRSAGSGGPLGRLRVFVGRAREVCVLVRHGCAGIRVQLCGQLRELRVHICRVLVYIYLNGLSDLVLDWAHCCSCITAISALVFLRLLGVLSQTDKWRFWGISPYVARFLHDGSLPGNLLVRRWAEVKTFHPLSVTPRRRSD